MECYTAPSLKVAVITLEVIEIFNDILIPDELYALVYSKEYLSDMNRLIAIDRCEQISQFIADENGFGCIQNQSLDRCEQISQFIAHENGFGCIQNQSPI